MPTRDAPQKPAQQHEDDTQRDMTRTILMDYCHESGRDANEVWRQAQAAGASMDDPDSLSAIIDKWESGINAEPREEQ